MYIDGVEVTQAIQYYHSSKHLIDPKDRGPDNSVRLIANKLAWVRVYIRSGLTTAISGVTGSLEAQQRNFAGKYVTVYTPSGGKKPTPITAETVFKNYSSERSNLQSSINFIIPAEYMMSHMRLKVKVSSGSLSDESDVYLDVTLRQTMNFAGIMIGYDGPQDNNIISPNIILPAPTITDLQETSAFTVRVMPVESNATYRIAGIITWGKPLTGWHSNDNSQALTDLCTEVRKAIMSDGNQPCVIYYGLFNNNITLAGKYIGYTTVGPPTASVCGVGNQSTMAHELGHYLGLGHAHCDDEDNPDPNYPAYEPYDSPGMPTASIGEYAINVSDGTIIPPTSKDRMSYCNPRLCFGLYHYQKLMFNQLLKPTFIDAVPWWYDYVLMTDPYFPPKLWLPDPPPPYPFRGIKINADLKQQPESLISVVGLVRSNTDLSVQSVVRLQAFRGLSGGRESEFTIELLDKDGKILSTASLYQTPSYAVCSCCSKDKDNHPHPPYAFQAFLDDVAPGAAMRISRKDNEVWIRHAPPEPPRIQSFSAFMRKRRTVVVKWDIESSADQKPEVWLQWSEDKDNIWHGLSTGLMGNSTEIDISYLPPGVIHLRMLANDGFFTTTSHSIPAKIPTRSPSLTILYPPKNIEILIDSSLRLWAVCTDSSGKPVHPESVKWFIDRKEVATGLDVFVPAPTKGKHRCTLKVVVDRKTIEQTVELKTVAFHSLPG